MLTARRSWSAAVKWMRPPTCSGSGRYCPLSGRPGRGACRCLRLALPATRRPSRAGWGGPVPTTTQRENA